MRTSKFSSPYVCLLFVAAYFLPAVLAAMTCVKHPSITIDLRKWENNGRENDVKSAQCTPNVYYDPWSKDNSPKVTAQTKIPEDGRMSRKGSKTGTNDYICDHLLELQMVKQVMEQPGGACDKAAEFAAANTPAEAIEKLRKIRWHTWQHSNLYFVEKTSEGRKGNTVSKGQSAIKGLVWHKINELFSLVVGGPGVNAVRTATAIDNEIQTQFPGASTTEGTVTTVWRTYIALVIADWSAKKAKAEAAKCSAMKRAAGGGGGGGSSGGGAPRKRAPTLPARMLRRHLSGMPTGFDSATSSSAFPPIGLSSLVERARKGAARSGPNAPPGRCCPAEKQPQKKVIPRKNVNTAPPPAAKPRKPAQTPAPRPANAKKQVAKRPASRARREVGKPRVQKRATPKRKPKVTPKPTRRPRGKPRQRRRRR